MGTGSYFEKALVCTNSDLVHTMSEATQGVDYDTIVGTGLSGTIFTARVAPLLDKKFAIVRKKDDESTHSGLRIEGSVGNRWVFADDFVFTGATLKRVLAEMKNKFPRCEFVGLYEYERAPGFSDLDRLEKDYRWFADLALGGRKLGPLTRLQMSRQYPWGPIVRTCPETGWTPELAKLIPLPPLKELELDYLDGQGQPTFWSKQGGGLIKADDDRVKDLIHQIKPLLEDTTMYNRFVGAPMDSVLVQAARLKGRGLDRLAAVAEGISRALDSNQDAT